jgi:hypothetical protein
MERSLRLRKEKALARARTRRLLVRGKLRPEQVSIAAGVKLDARSPLILDRVTIPEYEAP